MLFAVAGSLSESLYAGIGVVPCLVAMTRNLTSRSSAPTRKVYFVKNLYSPVVSPPSSVSEVSPVFSASDDIFDIPSKRSSM